MRINLDETLNKEFLYSTVNLESSMSNVINDLEQKHILKAKNVNEIDMTFDKNTQSITAKLNMNISCINLDVVIK